MDQAGRGNVDGGVQYSKNATEDRLEGRRQFQETEKAYGGRAAYNQAKSEGKTKLNYQQWVQVRTPAFKECLETGKMADKKTQPLDMFEGCVPDPNAPKLPRPPKTLDEAKTWQEVEVFYMAQLGEIPEEYLEPLSTETQESQESSTTEQETVLKHST